MSEKLSLTINGTQYEWHGSFGSVIGSREYGRRPGDVRYIKGHLFYVYRVHRHARCLWTKQDVSWIPIQDITPEWLREFKRTLFGTQESV